jgi:hypothetical protein
MLTMHTAAERPDLWERGIESADVWPEYNLHGDVLNQWWGLLDVELPELQFLLHDDETDMVVAEGHTGAFAWDGDDATLPPGIDPALETIFRERRAGAAVTTLCALAAESPRGGRRRGLAVEILGAMRMLAERQGLRHLVAPVRPSWKERYPVTPIEEYVRWRRADGQLLDPWMRVHERLGARVSTPLPQSLLITGSVSEWESWTGLPLPASGDYIFPEGRAPLIVDVDADRCTYWEPNVWMVHPGIEGAAG